MARACLVQFDDVQSVEHVWSMVRTRSQIDRVIAGVEANPGVVLFTMVNDTLRQLLQDGCRRCRCRRSRSRSRYRCARLLSPPREPRGSGQTASSRQRIFCAIDAMTFALNHDDGQSSWGLNDADVCLVGVSRTSKTPTCLYLANRGIKAANVPYVPGVPLPPELIEASVR